VQAARGEDFQLEQLRRVPLAETQLGGATLEATETFGLEFLQRLALHQQ
jgi:hypothetical protein